MFVGAWFWLELTGVVVVAFVSGWCVGAEERGQDGVELGFGFEVGQVPGAFDRDGLGVLEVGGDLGGYGVV